MLLGELCPLRQRVTTDLRGQVPGKGLHRPSGGLGEAEFLVLNPQVVESVP